MWRLIDYELRYFTGGTEIFSEDYYLVENVETKESKWIDWSTYSRFVDLGLLDDKKIEGAIICRIIQ